MPLNKIRPGLRVINKSNSVSKVTIHVAAGDSLEVSEEVAAQLAAQNLDFVPADSDDAAKALPYPPPVEEDTPDEPVAEVVEETKPKPTKRTAHKRS
jgi:hypothetical protein